MSRPGRGRASYRAVLALPHAQSLFAAAMLARLCYGLLGIPLLLALREGTGSYALAGTATGVFGLLTAILGPARARLVQRRHSALVALAVTYAFSLAALALACAVGVPAWLAIGCAALAGLFPPPVGPLMRALWGKLVADDDQLQRALSLDTAAESTVFAFGPVLGGGLVAVTSAPTALATCAVLVLVAFGWLAAALRQVPLDSDRLTTTAGRGPLRLAGLPPLLLLVWAIAAAIYASEVAILASRGTATAGLLIALVSVGGVLGGTLYGLNRWRGSLLRRPLALAAASCTFYVFAAVLHGSATAAVTMLLVGACADILLIAAYQLVDAQTPERSRLEAGAWLNTAYNLGAAAGSAAGGVLVDQASPATTFAAVAIVLGVCTALSSPAFLRGRATTAGERRTRGTDRALIDLGHSAPDAGLRTPPPERVP